MTDFKNILKDNNLTSLDDIKGYINNLTSLDDIKKYIKAQKKGSFEVLQQEDIQNRDKYEYINKDKYEYINKIINCNLIIQNATKIDFINCIFLNKVTISFQKKDSLKYIYIESCIFIEELAIKHNKSSKLKIKLNSVNAPIINIENNDVKSIDFNYCNVEKFVIIKNKSSIFSTFGCNISYPFISANTFDSISFPYQQINIKEPKILDLFYELKSSSYKYMKNIEIKKFFSNAGNLFKKNKKIEKIFDPFYYPDEIDLAHSFSLEGKQTDIDTIRFILNESNIFIDRSAKSQMRYLESIESQTSPFSKIMVCLFGALLKPKRILCWILGVVAIFGTASAL